MRFGSDTMRNEGSIRSWLWPSKGSAIVLLALTELLVGTAIVRWLGESNKAYTPLYEVQSTLTERRNDPRMVDQPPAIVFRPSPHHGAQHVPGSRDGPQVRAGATRSSARAQLVAFLRDASFHDHCSTLYRESIRGFGCLAHACRTRKVLT